MSLLADRLAAHLMSGAMFSALLSVLGSSDAAAWVPTKGLADVGAFLLHLASLSRQQRRKFQDALAFLQAEDTWHRELGLAVELLGRPNESCLWCRSKLIQLQKVEHLKEMLEAFGFRRPSGVKDDLANTLALLLPFCMAIRSYQNSERVSAAGAASAARAPAELGGGASEGLIEGGGRSQSIEDHSGGGIVSAGGRDCGSGAVWPWE